MPTWRAGTMATTLLGTPHSRRTGHGSPPRLCPLQPGQAWLCASGEGLAAFELPSLSRTRVLSGGLGHCACAARSCAHPVACARASERTIEVQTPRPIVRSPMATTRYRRRTPRRARSRSDTPGSVCSHQRAYDRGRTRAARVPGRTHPVACARTSERTIEVQTSRPIVRSPSASFSSQRRIAASQSLVITALPLRASSSSAGANSVIVRPTMSASRAMRASKATASSTARVPSG